MLTIADVDSCIAENGVNHRTSRYDLMTRQDDKSRLVVRRGQEFYLHLTLSRDYEPSIDGMSIIFTVDGVERPLYGHGTLVATAVLYPGEPSEGPWHATIDAIQHNFIRLKVSDQRRIVFRSFSIGAVLTRAILLLSLSQIVAAPDAIIGKWRIDIDTKNKNLDGAVSYTVKQPFYLIFNPWCRGREFRFR